VRLVIDADVLIGALDGNDSHHREARKLFTFWRRRGAAVMISVVNLTEVLVGPAAERAKLAAAREAIAALGVNVHQAGEAIAVEAARFRGRYPISLPDAFLLATSKIAGATVASFDEKVRRAAAGERIDLV
jgi:predicted nucleic acid-binding protein